MSRDLTTVRGWSNPVATGEWTPVVDFRRALDEVNRDLDWQTQPWWRRLVGAPPPTRWPDTPRRRRQQDGAA